MIASGCKLVNSFFYEVACFKDRFTHTHIVPHVESKVDVVYGLKMIFLNDYFLF